MSHTGQVIEEDGSPGIIRVITTGYLFEPDPIPRSKVKAGTLLFRKPWGNFDMSGREAMCAARERFIAYLPNAVELGLEERMRAAESFRKGAAQIEPTKGKNFEPAERIIEQSDKMITDSKRIKRKAMRISRKKKKKSQFDYGDPVIFNVKSVNTAELKGHGTRLRKLKDYIPESWKQKMGAYFHKWQFKYVATEIEALPDKFILRPFYEFIGDLEKESTETILEKLSTIERLKLEYVHTIELRNEPPTGKGKTEPRNIHTVQILDSRDFDDKLRVLEDCGVKDIVRNNPDVDDDIANSPNNEHKISNEEELPTRVEKKVKWDRH